MGGRSKTVATYAVCLALSLILSLLEGAFPPPVPALPYVKLGLSNLPFLFLFAVATERKWIIYAVLAVKCLLASLFAGAITMILYSLPSALAAFGVTHLLIKTAKFGLPAISAFSAAVFNAVQLLAACIVAGSGLMYLMPYMLAAGVAAGFVTGTVVWLVIKYMPATYLLTEAAQESSDENNP